MGSGFCGRTAIARFYATNRWHRVCLACLNKLIEIHPRAPYERLTDDDKPTPPAAA